MTDTGAQKFDQDKPRFELIPPLVEEQLAKVLTHGAKKYGDYNWAKGFGWARVYGAAKRHMDKWYSEEWPDFDDETGLNHLVHAMCNLVFLIQYAETHKELDDRPKFNHKVNENPPK